MDADGLLRRDALTSGSGQLITVALHGSGHSLTVVVPVPLM